MMTAAFLLGLAGSLHCAAMCGPIALALPLDRAARWRLAGQLLRYNAGRAATYAALGAAFGLAGGAAAGVAGLQQWLSVAAGFFLIALAFFSVKIESKLAGGAWLSRLFLFVKKGLSRLLKKGGEGPFFAIGMLNGLVPCGLVYAAAAGALASGGAAEGAFFMLFFGLGTWPMMLATALGGRFFIKKLGGRRLGWVRPVLFAAAGAVVLLRAFGLDLMAFAGGLPGLPPICH